jgi:3-phosphoshikimate 1-carboxyvinyltransferase
VHFVGRGRLPERPLGDLVSALERNGVELSSDHLPLSTRGRLRSGRFELPGNVSSQYVTGLLLALPLLKGASEIALTTELESLDYVRITLGVLEQYGIVVEQRGNGFHVPGDQQYRSPRNVVIEGDWSNAAFFLAAGAIGTAPLTVIGLAAHSLQGDRRVVDFLRQFGAEVSVGPEGVRVEPRQLLGCTIDIGETPDLLPVLAVVAACAEGETRFCNAARLRLKESDRLQAPAPLLRALGGEAEELPDGLVVRGGRLMGGSVDSFHDHRIAMAAAVAACACSDPVTIQGAEAVGKSYPAFYTDYQSLGGVVDVI